MSYAICRYFIAILLVVFCRNAGAMEDLQEQSSDSEVECQVAIEMKKQSGSHGYLPDEVKSTQKCRDLDGCRLLFLANFDEANCYAVPESLVGTFSLPSGKSRKLSWYSAAVITCIGTTTLLAGIYQTLWACTPDSDSDVPDYGCLAQNSFVPLVITGAGGIAANIVGQCIYDKRLNKFEGRRNQAQDSAHELEEIYRDVADFLLRTYLDNLLLAKEERDYLGSEEDDGFSRQHSVNLGWELFLDAYLKDEPVNFRVIFDFFEKWDQIKENLRAMGLMESTIKKIAKPIEQLRDLLCSEAGTEGRNAIFRLVFTDEQFPTKTAKAIKQLITDEELLKRFDRITPRK